MRYIHLPAAWVDIDQDRSRADRENILKVRFEVVGGKNDLVAGFNTNARNASSTATVPLAHKIVSVTWWNALSSSVSAPQFRRGYLPHEPSLRHAFNAAVTSGQSPARQGDLPVEAESRRGSQGVQTLTSRCARRGRNSGNATNDAILDGVFPYRDFVRRSPDLQEARDGLPFAGDSRDFRWDPLSDPQLGDVEQGVHDRGD